MRRALALLHEGLRHVARHPLRSLLTALTSAVAIAVTVNVISLSYGLDEDVRRDVGRFGRRTVDVTRFPNLVPGRLRPALGPDEEAGIRHALAGLDALVVPHRQTMARVTLPEPADGTARLPVVGTTPGHLATTDVAVLAGRWLEEGDAAGVTVLDASAAVALFGEPAAQAVGEAIALETASGTLEGTVVGVLEDPLTHRALFEAFDAGRGARTVTSALLSFRNAYVPLDALPGTAYSGLSILLPSEQAVDEAARRLREIWPADEENPFMAPSGVGVFVRREWMEVMGASTQTGALLGNVIWMIIVGVAVVMISTLNLLTIRERYDELAIRRVEGARRRDVAWQVTAEGTVLALAGGLLGLPLGHAGAVVLRGIVEFPFRFEIRYALAATAVAAGIGLLASVLPARRAARLQPARVLSRRVT